MESDSKISRKTSMVFLLIAVVIAAILSVYAAFTYPRDVVSFQVSFTIGADVQRREFDVPILHRYVQVEVVVNSGTSLWTAKILDGDRGLWGHSASQGGQTTYRSGWIELSSGHYNFTFSTLGLGSLKAEIKVTSKGGFW